MDTTTENRMRSALSSASRLDKLGCLTTAHEKVQRGEPLPPIAPTALAQSQLDGVIDELRLMRQRRARELRKKHKAGRPAADNLLAILKESSISVRHTGFGNPEVDNHLRDRFDGMIGSGRPIVIAMISGGLKVANPLKVGRSIAPEIADWMAIVQLQAAADAMAESAGHPVKMVLVADGHLHAGDAGLDAGQGEVFMNSLRRDAAERLGAADVVIASPLPELDARWFEYHLDETRRIRRGAAVDLAFRRQLDEQAEALISSINIRHRGWSYGHTISVFAAVAGQPADGAAARDAEDLRRLALQVSIGYTATNHAVRDLALVERVVRRETGQEQFIRASVHAKRFEPRPALAPSNRLSRHYLLPMHSVGRLEPTPDGRLEYGPIFDLEARMGDMELLAFRDDRTGQVRPLFFRAKADSRN